MIESKHVEKLEQSRVRLSVTINPDVAREKYDKLLAEYAKKAQLKGFRPGKVPIQVLEQKFGEGIRFDVAQKLIEESLKIIFEELDEKPLSFAPPLLEGKPELSPGAPFSYVVSYDVLPQFSVETLTGFTLEEPQVSIGATAVNEELERLRQQNAIVIDKTAGKAEAGNIATINYCRLDENGNEIPDSHREDYTLTIAAGHAPFNIDDDLVGMAVNEEKNIETTLEEDGNQQKGTLKVKLNKLKERDLPDIDDEFAQDIDEEYKTLKDLKAGIGTQLERTKQDRLKKLRSDLLMKQIIETNPIVLPESMVEAELESGWRNLLYELGGNEKTLEMLLKAQNKGKPDLYNEWRPGAERRLKTQLIVQKLIEEYKMEADEEEVTEKIKELAINNNTTEEKLREHYEKNNLMEYLKHDILETKLVEQLLKKNTVKKGKKMKYMDFIQNPA